MRHAHRRRDQRVHRIALVHDALQVESRGEFRACRGALAADGAVLRACRVQVEEVAHGREQARIVPGLRDVVRGAGLDEFHRGLEVGPGGEQDHRQLRVLRADLAEQGDALLAGSRLAPEVHVLDHEVHRLPRQRVQAGDGRFGADHPRAVHGQEDVERGAHGLAVVDHEYGALGQAVRESLVVLVLHCFGCGLGQNGCNVLRRRNGISSP